MELKKYDNVEDARSATQCFYNMVFMKVNQIGVYTGASTNILAECFSEIKDSIMEYDNARRQAEEMKAEGLKNFPKEMAEYFSGKVRDFLNDPKLKHNDSLSERYGSFLVELELIRKGMA